MRVSVFGLTLIQSGDYSSIVLSMAFQKAKLFAKGFIFCWTKNEE